MTREGALKSFGSVVVEAAILVIEMEEVFVARMAWEGQILASWEKIWVLRERISGTASMTKSTSERSSIFVVVVRRERAVEASDWEMRCLETSFSRSLSVSHCQKVLLPCRAWVEDLQTSSLCLSMLESYQLK